MPSPLPAKYSAAKAFCVSGLAAFTIGTKTSNTINVAVQLKNARGQAVSQIAHVRAYLSDNADGSTLTATATTSPLIIHTNGVILSTPVSGKMVEVLTNSSGQVDLDVIQTSGGTNYYLTLQMPDGSVLASTIISF